MSEREYPPQDYFPSCKVQLILRFEEFTRQPSVEIPSTRVTIRKGEGTGLAPQPEVEPPQQKDSSADGLTHVIAGIVPKTASVSRNSIQIADTASITIKYADMPFDPRTIRAAAVRIFMGSVKPDDFAAGIAGSDSSSRSGSTSTAQPLNLIPDSFVDDNGRRRSNLRFEGWVDDWSADFGDDEPLITLDCTDNTRQLLDQEAPPQLTLDPKLGIAEAIEKYISEFPQFRGYEVQYYPLDGRQPTLESVLGKPARKKGKAFPPGDKDSVWDYLTDACGIVAHNIRLDGTLIVIQRARQLFSGIDEGRVDDPFTQQGGRVVSGERLARRLLVYGRNLSTLRISRQYGKQAEQNVEVRSYHPAERRVLIARHPPFKDGRQTKANPGDEGEQTYTVFRVQGVTDETVLGQIAQEAYEQINRNEVSVEYETRNLASYGGGASDPDLLDMKVGDFFDVTLQREEAEFQVSTINNLEAELAIRGRGAAYLRALGYDDALIETYLNAFMDTGIVSAFIAKQIDFDWDESDGITIKVNGVNFAVVARSDQDQPGESEE